MPSQGGSSTGKRQGSQERCHRAASPELYPQIPLKQEVSSDAELRPNNFWRDLFVKLMSFLMLVDVNTSSVRDEQSGTCSSSTDARNTTCDIEMRELALTKAASDTVHGSAHDETNDIEGVPNDVDVASDVQLSYTTSHQSKMTDWETDSGTESDSDEDGYYYTRPESTNEQRLEADLTQLLADEPTWTRRYFDKTKRNDHQRPIERFSILFKEADKNASKKDGFRICRSHVDTMSRYSWAQMRWIQKMHLQLFELDDETRKLVGVECPFEDKDGKKVSFEPRTCVFLVITSEELGLRPRLVPLLVFEVQMDEKINIMLGRDILRKTKMDIQCERRDSSVLATIMSKSQSRSEKAKKDARIKADLEQKRKDSLMANQLCRSSQAATTSAIPASNVPPILQRASDSFATTATSESSVFSTGRRSTQTTVETQYTTQNQETWFPQGCVEEPGEMEQQYSTSNAAQRDKPQSTRSTSSRHRDAKKT